MTGRAVRYACDVDVFLFSSHNARWKFVFQPKYAAYLNPIKPWWKVFRSLAVEGRGFESWEKVVEAIKVETEYRNKHRHLFAWVAADVINCEGRPALDWSRKLHKLAG